MPNAINRLNEHNKVLGLAKHDFTFPDHHLPKTASTTEGKVTASRAFAQQRKVWRVGDSHSEDEGREALGEEEPLPAVQAADIVQRQQTRRQWRADDLCSFSD